MKKNYIKALSFVLPLVISELSSMQVEAQAWYGNGYYYERDINDLEGEKKIDEINLNYDEILGKLTYEDLCYFDFQEFQHWYPIALYSSADRAINQVEAVESENYHLYVSKATIKNVYQLVDGKPSLIDDISILNQIDKDNLAFSLVKIDSSGNEIVVGYLNGKDTISWLNTKGYGRVKTLK